jgi:hypothetical protein
LEIWRMLLILCKPAWSICKQIDRLQVIYLHDSVAWR